MLKLHFFTQFIVSYAMECFYFYISVSVLGNRKSSKQGLNQLKYYLIYWKSGGKQTQNWSDGSDVTVPFTCLKSAISNVFTVSPLVKSDGYYTSKHYILMCQLGRKRIRTDFFFHLTDLLSPQEEKSFPVVPSRFLFTSHW